jgi:hypothetical protein
MPLDYRPYEYGIMFADYIPEAEKLKGTHRIPYIYSFHVQKAVSATAVEFVTNTTAFSVQAGGTHEKLAIDSVTTDDNASGSGCAASLKVWGVDSAKNMRIFSTNLSGITVASGATAMYEINTLYVGSYGTSAQNCKGSCWAAMIGKNSQHIVSISAGQNHSQNCRIWFPKGWRAKILSLHAYFATDAKHSVNAVVFPSYYDAYENKQFDGSHEQAGFGFAGATFGPETFARTYGNDTTMGKLTFFGKNLSGTETLGIAVKVMLWAEPGKLGTGQFKHMVGV